MQSLSREEMARENQDPPEEIEWGKRMSNMRSKFLKELVDEMEADNRRKKNAAATPQPPSYSMSGFSGSFLLKNVFLRSSLTPVSVLLQSLAPAVVLVPIRLPHQRQKVAEDPPTAMSISPQPNHLFNSLSLVLLDQPNQV